MDPLWAAHAHTVNIREYPPGLEDCHYFVSKPMDFKIHRAKPLCVGYIWACLGASEGVQGPSTSLVLEA